MSNPFVRIEEKNDLRIVYYRADGSSAIYLGGRRNWRNNNPGNIGYGDGKLVKRLGAIGKAGGFAVFPDYETGRKAIFGVLKKDDFQSRTVARAIEVWAPKEDKNNPEMYKNFIFTNTRIDLNRQINTLTDMEIVNIVNAIEAMEGKGAGKIIEVPVKGFPRKKQITKVKKDKNGIIDSYYIEDIGWVSKEQGIDLALGGEVDAVVATSSVGNPFLRTRPDVEIVNLEDLG
jgi:hypothetical protein